MSAAREEYPAVALIESRAITSGISERAAPLALAEIESVLADARLEGRALEAERLLVREGHIVEVKHDFHHGGRVGHCSKKCMVAGTATSGQRLMLPCMSWESESRGKLLHLGRMADVRYWFATTLIDLTYPREASRC